MHDASGNENVMPSQMVKGVVQYWAFFKLYDDSSQVGAEIEQVVGILQEYAGGVLLCVQPNTGRRWRDNVLSSLYAKSRQLVRGWLIGRLSDGFPVRQGSVLSPTVFLLVMDHLLRIFKCLELHGLSINSF